MISATVGLLLDALTESDSLPAQIISGVLGVSWALLTFFIIPVIVFEKPSTTGMFRQSGQTFKKTYGESVVSLFGATVVGLLAALPFVAVGGAIILVTGVTAAALPFIVIGVAVGQVVTFSIRGIVKTGLYFYAQEGERPTEFDEIFDQLNLSGQRDGAQTTGSQFGGI
ncbi:MAG: hypothetical protein J07HX5_00152 [halophilic archaeon J07HX5]|nr:MAG: hypothetical protein J07HX5_00152 [halophilic archaeon J07HX5]